MIDSLPTRHCLAVIQAELPAALPLDLTAALKIVRPIVAKHHCSLSWTTEYGSTGDQWVTARILSSEANGEITAVEACVRRGAVEDESRLQALCYLLGCAASDQAGVAEAAEEPAASPLPEADAERMVEQMLAKLRQTTTAKSLEDWGVANHDSSRTISKSFPDLWNRLKAGYQEHKAKLALQHEKG
jgi:hypothetical protein